MSALAASRAGPPAAGQGQCHLHQRWRMRMRITNIVLWARRFERYRREVMSARLMIVDGELQRSREGVGARHGEAGDRPDRSARQAVGNACAQSAALPVRMSSFTRSIRAVSRALAHPRIRAMPACCRTPATFTDSAGDPTTIATFERKLRSVASVHPVLQNRREPGCDRPRTGQECGQRSRIEN